MAVLFLKGCQNGRNLRLFGQSLGQCCLIQRLLRRKQQGFGHSHMFGIDTHSPLFLFFT